MTVSMLSILPLPNSQYSFFSVSPFKWTCLIQGNSLFNAWFILTLTLAKLALDSTDDSSFVEVMRVIQGAVQTQQNRSTYNILGDTLARRTYDESGDYVVRNLEFSSY